MVQNNVGINSTGKTTYRTVMFPCTACGLCCQNISGIEELKGYDIGNGVCRYFNSKEKKCTIYENRPEICSVDKMFEKLYYKEFTQKIFYQANAKVCNQLQEEYGLDKSYRINIEEI